jgi:predicted ATPase/DNA-binding SARP family transcriptional activator
VSRLRTVIGGDLLVARPPGYALELSPDCIDVQRFEELLGQGKEALARGAAGVASKRLRAALSLWRGPALADVSASERLVVEAKRLEELRLVCLEHRIESDLALGRHDWLVAELEQLVEQEPLRERLWQQLVIALYRCGRQADALAAYRRARSVLGELGLEPSEELTQLERAVLRQEIEILRPGEERHNVPAQLTSFVGRERELAEVQGLLRHHRLVTLTGVGGCGKTRLAVEIAARQIDEWQGGVWLIDLSTISDPNLVPSAVATTLACPERPVTSVYEALAEHLRRLELLLVLDNCEHLLAACAGLVNTLLPACAQVRILATSRRAFPAAGGLEYRVDPLPVLPETASVAELERSASVRLFFERGRAVRPELAVDLRLRPVARICRELDGLPLAIELAAARTKVLSVEEIARRLDDRFRFLRSRFRSADPRHQTLWATMDWSYELLSDDERALLEAMSVFIGGAMLEAIDSICLEGGGEGVLELVTGLVDASLVIAEEGSVGTRYRLLETVRQYAAARLEQSGGRGEVRRRQAQFFTLLAERAVTHIESREAFAALAEEEGNLRSALAFATGGREPELMLQLAGALWQFWNSRDQVEEGYAWLEEAIRFGPSAISPAGARALRGLAAMVDALGRPAEARSLLEEALALYRELDDDDGIARCLNNLGRIALDEGELDGATTLFKEALAIHEQVDDSSSLPPLWNLAEVAIRRGDLLEARSLCEEVLTKARASQNDLLLGSALTHLAWMAAEDGCYDDAARLTAEALNVHVRLGARGGITFCLLLAALVATSRGSRDDAAVLVDIAVAERDRRGMSRPLTPVDERLFAALKRALGEGATVRRGDDALSLDDAIELAARVLV